MSGTRRAWPKSGTRATAGRSRSERVGATSTDGPRSSPVSPSADPAYPTGSGSLKLLPRAEFGQHPHRCAWAGPAQETMIPTAEGGNPATFTDEAGLSDYAAGTGSIPTPGLPVT